MRPSVRTFALLVLVLSVVIALAAFAVPFLTRPQEQGSTLSATITNGTDAVHIVYVRASVAADGTRVGFTAVTVSPGGTERATLGLSKEYNGVPLEVVFDDQPTGATETRPWTPSAGEREEMGFSCPAA